MKILYVVTGLTVGGAEKIVTNLSDEISSLGHEVKIVILKGIIKVSPENDSIEIINLNLNSPLNIFSAYHKFKNVIQAFRPDVVHSHMFHANLLSRIFRIFSSFPKLICTLHNSKEHAKFRNLFYRYTNFLSDFNTNVSEEATKAYIKNGAFKKGELHTVYNGINLDNYKFDYDSRVELRKNFKIEQDCKVIVSIGRLNFQKDYPNLIYAINNIKSENIKLFIVGEGEELDKLRMLVTNLGLEAHIIFLGLRKDISHILSMADIFVLSSSWEGLPTVLIEAMSCQRLVIATDCGGSKEIIDNSDFLVPVADSEKLSSKILSAMSLSQDEIKSIEYNNREKVIERFSLKSMTNNWLMIYLTK